MSRHFSRITRLAAIALVPALWRRRNLRHQRSTAAACAVVLLAAIAGGVVPRGDAAAADTAPLTFTNFTTANGLGDNFVFKVFASGSTIYACGAGGLNISTNGGTNFTNLLSDGVSGVYASGSSVYAATTGLAISTNSGASFAYRTTADGLGSNTVTSVFVGGSTIYAGTQEGLSTSTNGGASFTNNYITGNEYDSYVTGVYASGSNVYAAFYGEGLGLYISRNGGLDYMQYTMANGLGSDNVLGVLANGNTVYAATEGGLSISTNGGFNYTNYTTADGLGGNNVQDVYAIGSTVYAATDGGLSISTNGGTSFTNYTTANGLGSDLVYGVYAIRNTVYAATLEGLGIAVAPLVWNTTTGTWNGTAAAWNSAVGNAFTFTNGDAVIFSGTAGGTVTISGAIQPSSVTVSATSGTYSFVSSAGNLLTGTGGLFKSGGGTLVLAGSNAFAGPTNVAGGVLALGHANALAGGGLVTFAGGTLQFSAANTADHGARIKNSTSAIALDTNGQSVTVAGVIDSTNVAGLRKSGGGNLVLAGTSSYTGATSVEFGRLSVDGALGNTSVAVLAGAELGGSGSIGGPLSVAGFGTLSPGNSIESIATGAATFAAGAVFDYEVDSTNPLSLGSAADLLVVNGDLNLDPGNGTVLSFADLASSPNPFVDDTTIFALINYSGLWNGGLFRYDGTVLADGDRFFVGGQEWEIDYDRSSSAGLDNFTADYLPSGKFVTVMAVPEPSTVVMAVAGLGYAGFSVWRRRKRALRTRSVVT